MTKFVELELQSGAPAVFHLVGNYVVVGPNGKDGVVSIHDGVHNNGGWKLSSKYSLSEVMELLKNN
jgi:hypothetical protein